jgi:hypothetical protein
MIADLEAEKRMERRERRRVGGRRFDAPPRGV